MVTSGKHGRISRCYAQCTQNKRFMQRRQRTGDRASNGTELLGLGSVERPKRYGITKRFYGRNAVLEVPSGGTAHYVEGAWFENDGQQLAFGAIGFEPHATRG